MVSVLVDIPRALAFGVAALWLLAPPAGRGNRLGRCLRTFLVLAAFGAFSFAVAGGWDEGAGARLRGLPGGGRPQFAAWAGSTAQLLLLAALALIIALATALTSLVWRSGRFLRLCLSLLGPCRR